MRPIDFRGLTVRSDRARRPGEAWEASLRRVAITAAALGVIFATTFSGVTQADTTPLTVLDPNLQVTTVGGAGLSQPIGIVFLGSANDFFVLEKASGQVK